MVRAGLWEQDIQLPQYERVNYKAVMRLAEEQSIVGIVTSGIEHLVDNKIPQDDLWLFIMLALQIEQQNQTLNEYAENFIELQDIYNNYYDGIKQNICHLIALSNLKHDENALQWFKKNNPYIEQEVLDKISKDTTIKFINLLYLFDYKNNPTDKYGNSYPDLLEDFKSKLPDKLRMELLKDDRIFNSYYELFDNIKGQMPEGLSKYLGSRYFEK